MPPIIDPQKCVGCGLCVQICPCEVFDIDHQAKTVPTVLYPQECWHCNACVLDCPQKAMDLRFPLHYILTTTDTQALNGKAGG